MYISYVGWSNNLWVLLDLWSTDIATSRYLKFMKKKYNIGFKNDIRIVILICSEVIICDFRF